MKQILLAAFLIFGLTATYSLAQMGHGMMRGGHMMGQGGHAMDDKGVMGGREYGQPDDIFIQKHKPEDDVTMHHRQMMSVMMGSAQDMAIIMRQMSVIMGNITNMDSKTAERDMQSMSNMIKYIATEMNRMSDMMGRGSATDDEVRDMQKRMIGLQEQLWEMKR